MPGATIASTDLTANLIVLGSGRICGVTLALHVLRALWREPGNAEYSPQSGRATQHSTEPCGGNTLVSGAMECRIGDQNSCIPVSPPSASLSSPLQPLDFYIYFYIRRILDLLRSVVVFHFLCLCVSLVTPKPMVKRIQSIRELKMLNSKVKEGRIWFGNRQLVFLYKLYRVYEMR
jgi:hypothetical protein